MMNEKDIRNYAAIMKELDLTGIEITEDGRTIRLERASAQTAVYVPQPQTGNTLPDAEPASDLEEIISPMVGIFYAAPAENEEPYVKVGSRISKGDTLCIIEAMKLMNEITAETDGVVSEICISDGNAVDYGTVLFRISK